MTTKKNFGLPVNTLCAAAFILAFSAYSNAANWFYFLVIAGLVFTFNCEARVKAAFKQGAFLAAAAWLINRCIGALNTLFFSVFEIELSSTLYTIINKIDQIFNLAVVIVFILLAAAALFGMVINVKALDDLSSDTVKCPNCGAELNEGTTFCNKCGTKL